MDAVLRHPEGARVDVSLWLSRTSLPGVLATLGSIDYKFVSRRAGC